MKKRLRFILIIITVGLLLGFLNSVMIYEGFWQHFNNGLKTVPFYIHFVYGILALFFAILAHELGHFISFRMQGIKPKALYALCIAFVNDNGWKIRFIPKFLLLVGGIVIPEHLTIRDNETADSLVGKFKHVLLAGPIASIIYGVVIILIWISFLFTNIFWLNGLLFTVMLITTLMTILAILSSRISRSGMYGDFAAIKALDEDKLFRLTYLIQLTTTIEHDTKSMDYFWPHMINMLETSHQTRSDLYTNLLGQYIYEIAFEGRIACTSIEKKFNSLTRNNPKTEDDFVLYLNIIYYYESMGQRDTVMLLLNKLDTSKIKVPPKVLLFYLRLTNHILLIKDETSFLNDSKNIHTSSMAWVYKPLNMPFELKDIKK